MLFVLNRLKWLIIVIHKKQSRRLRHMFSAPFTWLFIIPLIIMDVFIELYQNIVFRILSMPLVKRRNYIKIDRHKLLYLNLFDRINCAYCGYANGLIHYVSVIAGKTEEYWCGIQHKKQEGFVSPSHHKDFTPYGDEDAFYRKYF